MFKVGLSECSCPKFDASSPVPCFSAQLCRDVPDTPTIFRASNVPGPVFRKSLAQQSGTHIIPHRVFLIRLFEILFFGILLRYFLSAAGGSSMVILPTSALRRCSVCKQVTGTTMTGDVLKLPQWVRSQDATVIVFETVKPFPLFFGVHCY
jgi:hypothetical protein